MPDITMCQGFQVHDGIGVRCQLRESCRRHKAKPDQHQSFFMEAPFSREKKGEKFIHTCEFKIEVDNVSGL